MQRHACSQLTFQSPQSSLHDPVQHSRHPLLACPCSLPPLFRETALEMEAASGLPALEAGLLGFCASRAAVLHLISIADSLEALLAQVGTPGLKGLSSGYSSVVSGLPPPRACWPKVAQHAGWVAACRRAGTTGIRCAAACSLLALQVAHPLQHSARQTTRG